jgi:biopolymer transport protein ExbB
LKSSFLAGGIFLLTEGLSAAAWSSDHPIVGSQEPSSVTAAGALPRDLSPMGMFLNADLVVQLIILGLILASIVTWTVWLAKTLEIRAARRRLLNGLVNLEQAETLAEAAKRVAGCGAVDAIVAAAETEIRLTADPSDRDGIKERVASRLERIEMAAGRHISRGLVVVATIGATAPFIGLFGTVWGIMNSFIGISQAQTTNLAIVAPGIAEALLATGIGLVAAIPAVIIYNYFTRAISGYRQLLGDASAAAIRLVSRDCRQGRLNPALAKAAE